MSAYELLKDVLSAAQKIDNVDLMRKLIVLQTEIVELTDENRRLREQIATREDLEFRENAYWRKSGEGPFCSKCWDADGKLIRLLKRHGYLAAPLTRSPVLVNRLRHTCPDDAGLRLSTHQEHRATDPRVSQPDTVSREIDTTAVPREVVAGTLVLVQAAWRPGALGLTDPADLVLAQHVTELDVSNDVANAVIDDDTIVSAVTTSAPSGCEPPPLTVEPYPSRVVDERAP